MRVLTAVVEDDDGVGAGGAHAALAARLLGGGRAHDCVGVDAVKGKGPAAALDSRL